MHLASALVYTFPRKYIKWTSDLQNSVGKTFYLELLSLLLVDTFGVFLSSCASDEIHIIWQNELSAILRFGAEELFKEEKTDEETKRKLESMDIDEILERAEKVETKAAEGEEGNELLSAFKACHSAQP